MVTPRKLEAHLAWRADDVGDPAAWTVELDAADQAELHAAYEDDVPNGVKRHLKRLWLSTRYLTDRPPNYAKEAHAHWGRNRSVSRLHAQPVA